MNEKLKEFLDAKRNDEKQRQEEEKQKILIELGLYEKVYSPENKYSEEFPFFEYDPINSINVYYKKVVIEVNEEEYEEIKKYSKKEDNKNGNIIVKIFRIIAWITFIGGFIAGIIFGTKEVERGLYYTYTDTVFSFGLAFTYWCASFISGMMFLGFAEIISLLNDIKNK